MKKPFFSFISSVVKGTVTFTEFTQFFGLYLKGKIIHSSIKFENQKNSFVRIFMVKRGRYSRLFLHFSTIGVIAIGVMIAPFIASSYPVFSEPNSILIADSETQQSIILDENVFETQVSQKPRDKVIDYKVQKGDTVSTVAQKFSISADSIRWANDLDNDALTVGDNLKILPVTGIWHKVQSGESVYSIAKKYDSNPQQIVDFPFNEFANPENFSLIVGQMVVVPDGVAPEAISTPRAPSYQRPVYIAQTPTAQSSAGFSWPLGGGISQYSSWYHTAIDLTSPVGTPIVAAKSGKVVKSSLGTWDGGYGNNIIVDHGDGTSALYAHMSSVYVGIGGSVVGGKTVVGAIGMTGRTTGPHLHFEIRRGGALINPMSVLN